jgi:hypothetical protein
MNPEIAGYTREGYPVEKHATQSLAFTFVSLGWEGGYRFGFSIAIEFNKTETGKKRPYIVIQICGLLIQSGWLF